MQRHGFFWGIAAGVAALAAGTSAEARQPYKKAFQETYTKIPAAMINCGACHGGEMGKDKKVLSDYATAFKDALGGTNVKDADKIAAALKTAEEKDYEPGKTYGMLLLNGMLPPPAK